MTILDRGPITRADHFTIIPNDFARDARLSLRALGLMTRLMSHRTGWSVSVASMAANGIEGEAALKGAVRELERFGYLERRQEVVPGGKFGPMRYTLKDPHMPSVAPLGDLPPAVCPPAANHSHKKTISKEDHSREKTRGGAFQPEAHHRAAVTPPGNPLRCPIHELEPAPGPCGGCADARRAAQAAEKAETTRRAEEALIARERQHQAVKAAIDGCALCGPDGYRGRMPCDHDPDADDVARRGRDHLYATMGWAG